MYELKDSYFFIFDTPTLVVAGLMLVLAIAGFLFFRRKRAGQGR
ncbi:hypothetical protein NCCP2716_28480 [Sporosarcina sp. NCCP-2716]|nr:LPXTG cell wall anchor domain-containing protein [Sporosarcina sp. NCCP-2716]GKV70350.1 hypothetical protein NCCP2716_28480 [Sporosarcina sp. NCCP-2716]